MLNLTSESLVFNCTDVELHQAIRRALTLACKASLIIYQLENIDFESVTTKTKIRGAFSKFVMTNVLPTSEFKFGEEYVKTAFDAYRQRIGYITQSQFNALMFSDKVDSLPYMRSYARIIGPSIGLFLVALHSNGAITLPSSFNWPIHDTRRTRCHKRAEAELLVDSELLSFIRTLDPKANSISHIAFEHLGEQRSHFDYFSTYGTKLLLATGWRKPEDVNLDELLKVKHAEVTIKPRGNRFPPYRSLLEVLKIAFGKRVKASVEDWSTAVRSQQIQNNPFESKKGNSRDKRNYLFLDGPRSDSDVLEEALHIKVTWGEVKHLKSLSILPGLNIDLKSMTHVWLQLETLYVNKSRHQTLNGKNNAIKWWNVYLFFYLPYWFSRNPDCTFQFPTLPSQLLKSVFISRLLPTTEERPVTFVEFMEAQCAIRNWKPSTHYGILNQLKIFFDYVEYISSDVPECVGFNQPFSDYDFPLNPAPKSTNKEPVPRRFFGTYLDFHEALLAHLTTILNLVLIGELTKEHITKIVSTHKFIDTFTTSNLVGFIPVLFTKTKTIPLRFIPNVLNLRVRKMQDGRNLYLPHPHSLNQNLVALHTGIRHNHIQWLDIETFDSLVDEDDGDFTRLLVNTDKVSEVPVKPHVNMRVIEILRSQRNWNRLIGEEKFHSLHYYNNNPRTKWPKIRPLFAFSSEGKPHDDGIYINAWKDTLCGLQGIMPLLTEVGRPRKIIKLLPPGFKAQDPNLLENLRLYSSTLKQEGDFCPLGVTTLTTPHSARVAVISQYISFLPTDLIGKYITGQTARTVSYYVRLDNDMLETEQVAQASRMRMASIKGAFETILSNGKNSTTHIHADNINSNLARSMKTNFEETIIFYGAMCITFSEESKSGIEILRNEQLTRAAFNKTEICPYDNNCPADLVKQLKGLRRCSLCPYAVRTIDHLPAVVAKKRQVAEMVDELADRLSLAPSVLSSKFTPTELDILEDELSRLCEDLCGWILNEEVLEINRQEISSNQNNRKWLVQKPEIIERALQRVGISYNETDYVLSRLGDCLCFPLTESPQVRARFDLLRRELLASAGDLASAFSSGTPIDLTAECAGAIRSMMTLTGLNVIQLADMIEKDTHLHNLPKLKRRLLLLDDAQ